MVLLGGDSFYGVYGSARGCMYGSVLAPAFGVYTPSSFVAGFRWSESTLLRMSGGHSPLSLLLNDFYSQ